MKFDPETFKISDSGKYIRISLIIAVVGFAASLAGGFLDEKTFYFSWLTSFTFWVSLGLGGLFITMLHHLTNSVWSVVIRRIAESVMMTLPVMLGMFVPLLIGLPHLYEWSDDNFNKNEHHAASFEIIETVYAADKNDDNENLHKEAEESHSGHDAHHELLATKRGYLNDNFFVIRTIIFFLIWSFLALALYKRSIKQETEGYSAERNRKLRNLSAPGMILFAITVSFAGFDWMMSLEPLWYSTIYGVYWFSGGIVAIVAFLILFMNFLRSKGILKDVISTEHYHTLGKLLFAFIIFWAYMAFSQYLLIWYANIPEETAWYHHRWTGGWKFVTVLIALAHFTIPFLVLMGQAAKRSAFVLGFFAVWMLIMHWIDLYWNVQPMLYKESAGFSWINVATMLAIGGIFFAFFWWRFGSHAIITHTDPKFEKAVGYVS